MRTYHDIIPAPLIKQLRLNHSVQLPLKGTSKERDFYPVVKLIIPGTYCLWLLTELDDDDIAFGAAQISQMELGSVWLPELAEINVKGLTVICDATWQAQRTLGEYARMARQAGGLLTI